LFATFNFLADSPSSPSPNLEWRGTCCLNTCGGYSIKLPTRQNNVRIY